jgi:hypothetical protein
VLAKLTEPHYVLKFWTSFKTFGCITIANEKDDDNGEDDEQLQQEVNNMVAALTAKRDGDAHLSSKADESVIPAKRERLLLSCDLSLEPGKDKMGSHSDGCGNGGLSNAKAESDEEQMSC